ncbi:sensor histidine kinase [Pseudonocardia sp. CA-142604]|uniref:sensor histidine kinase n=1 Tax=Pseudonocardia sp. CA-142604 TaxID=3240024 RepID=UPI003D920E5A
MTDSIPPNPARTRREWAVDACLFLFAVGIGVLSAVDRVGLGLTEPAWFFDVEQVVGALGCAAIWLRRRWPVAVAVALAALSAVFELVAGAMLVGLFTVAVHRPPRTSITVFGLSLITALAYVLLRIESDYDRGLLLMLGVAFQGVATGWGLVIHHHRQLVARAGAEARLLAEQAQHHAREAVAREMHDVLGHRLSLLSVYAGALEYRPGAPPEEVAGAAKVIRESAHQALQDLRAVIGVLRAPVGELPQPGLADVQELVDESSRAGMKIELSAPLPQSVPDTTGRTTYRVVQEALTNARKHAPGAEVRVLVAGARGEGLTVEVCNTAPGSAPAVGGGAAGQGLAGLAERVRLAGGHLVHGPTAAGGWRVEARLPWPP